MLTWSIGPEGTPQGKGPNRWSVVTIVALLAGLCTILGVSVADVFSHGNKNTSTASPSTTPRTSTTSPATSTSAPEPSSTVNQAPTWNLALGNDTFVDLDHGTVSDTAGRQYEFKTEVSVLR